MLWAAAWSSIYITYISIRDINDDGEYTVNAKNIAENLILNRSVDFVNQISFLYLAYHITKLDLSESAANETIESDENDKIDEEGFQEKANSRMSINHGEQADEDDELEDIELEQ